MKTRILTLIAVLAAFAAPAMAARHAGDHKLDSLLKERAHAPRGTSRVIIQTRDGSSADALIRSLRGRPGRRLHLLKAQVAEVPDGSLEALASRANVTAIHLDRRVRGTMQRTSASVGASWVQQNLGFDGMGVGVGDRVAIGSSTLTVNYTASGSGAGPRFIEAQTVRWPGSETNWPSVAQPTDSSLAWDVSHVPEKVREWYRSCDPLLIYIRELVEAKQATREEIAQIDKQVKAEIEEAVKFAVASPYPQLQEAAKDYFA